MTPRREYMEAIQNVGAATFILGLLGYVMAGSVKTLIICSALCLIGSAMIYGVEYIVDKLAEHEISERELREKIDEL